MKAETYKGYFFLFCFVLFCLLFVFVVGFPNLIISIYQALSFREREKKEEKERKKTKKRYVVINVNCNNLSILPEIFVTEHN